MSYNDYSNNQTLRLYARGRIKERDYWFNRLSGELVKSGFMPDKRPARGFADRGLAAFTFPDQVSSAIWSLARQSDYALHVILLASITALLYRCTGNTDIVTATPIFRQAGAPDLVNKVLPIRLQTREGESFRELLVEMRQRLKEAEEHQNYPLEVLVEDLKLEKTGLFAVAVMLDNIQERDYLDALHVDMTWIFSWADGLGCRLEYDASLYEPDTVERIMGYLGMFLAEAIRDVDQKVETIDIMGEAERGRILVDFNATETEYPQDKTLDELFTEQVQKTPDRTAVVGANNDSPIHGSVSYKDLDRRATDLAGELIEKGVMPNSIVALQVERSIGMIVGILGILKAGGAYLPIDPEAPEERVQYMLADSGAEIVIGPQAVGANCCSPIQDIGAECKGERQFAPTDLAYIIYTSGSTGRPKGVLLEQRGVVNLLTWFGRAFDLKTGKRVLLLTDYTFDPSVEDILGTLVHGASLFLGAKEIVIDREAFSIYVDKQQIDMINFVPTMLRALLADGEKLKSLKTIISGGEALKEEIRDEILGRGYELYNHYGPTEITVDALSGKCRTGVRVTLGKPISNMVCRIVDKWGHLSPLGVPGELLIGGPGLARGYLNNPELTAERFVFSPLTPHQSPLTNRLYKTGDLCRWLADGTIEFLDRLDFQVKIRGFRIELGEIETQVLKHPAVKEAVVIAREDSQNNKYLGAYLVVDDNQHLENQVLREFLSHSLPDYMIPAHFVFLERLPLTVSGKIDRSALPEPEIKVNTHYAPPRNEIENTLVNLWAEILGIGKEVTIGIDDDFFELGGHSLRATSLMARIYSDWHVQVPLAEFFKNPSIRGTAQYIDRASMRRVFSGLEAQEKKDYYRLSSAQERIYILQQMDVLTSHYNMPGVFNLEGKVDLRKLDSTFKKLLERHESLRTFFVLVDDEPVQRVLDQVEFALDVLRTAGRGGQSGLSGQELIELIIRSFIRPFDLARAPLMRVGLAQITEGKHLLLIDMHHIVFDGVSIDLMIKEFACLYGDGTLPALSFQYRDYAAWQNRGPASRELKKQEEYWLSECTGEIPVLALPIDHPRPMIQDFSGADMTFRIEVEGMARLRQLASHHGATSFMVLLAIFNVFLAKLSGQEDIVVGTPVAGRRYPGLENIIGMFANTLPIRSKPAGDKKFCDYLDEIKGKVIAGLENQDYPFERLVEKLGARRDAGRNPLFDVMLVLQNLDTPVFNLPGMRVGPLEFKTGIAKFDLTLAAAEDREGLRCMFEYSRRLFEAETVERLIGYFRGVIGAVTSDEGLEIREIDILPVEERERLVDAFSRGEDRVYPCDKRIDELFSEQVVKTPDRIAIVGANNDSPRHGSVSYKELDRLAAALAGELIEKGVMPNSIVALQVERSIGMIVCLLGILKAGGAYLPIDPEAPEERVQYMLQDSGAEIVFGPQAVGANCCSPIQDIGAECKGERQFAPTDLAYVIYTSGSTGRPKGVMIGHHNLCPLLHWGYEHLALTPDDRTIQNLSYFFDWSAWEIFITLTSGASLHLINRDILLNPRAMVVFMQERGITVLHCTPSQFQYLLNENLSFDSLGHLCLGAEKLDNDLLKRSLAAVKPDCRVYNMYGPTEATIMAAVLEIDKQGLADYGNLTSVPIGRFIGNTELWVLDRYLHLCPVRVAGELYIGGAGLARGYLNNPELTAERFVFSPLTTHHSPLTPNPSPTRGRGESAERGAAAIPGTGMLNRIAESPQFVKPQAKLSTVLAGSEGDWCVSPAPNVRLYKTGDLCRWLNDGTIEFLGRIDFQVKIRGFRIELGEIEAQLLKHPEIKETVVLAREADNGEKSLCAYLVAKAGQPLEVQVLREFLTRTLPAYMIPAHFVFLGQMPLNANGKVDRKALPEPEIKAGQGYVSPRNEVEQELVSLWAEILSIEASKIGIDDNFFQLGGHSLRATIMTAHIRRRLEVEVSLADVFKGPTVREIGRLIASEEKRVGIELEPLEEREYYDLSYNQKRLWLIHQLDPLSTAFHMPGRIPLEGDVDGIIIKKVLADLAARHESFHTGFCLVDHGPVQFILKSIVLDIETIDLSCFPEPEREERREKIYGKISGQPFDLGRPPLFRAMLVRLSASQSELMLNMHHIITDGWSMEVLKSDFYRLLEACRSGKVATLEPLDVRYRDFACWQNREMGDVEKKRSAQAHWQERLSTGGFKLDLPFDFMVQPGDNRGAAHDHPVGPELWERLTVISREYRTSLFVVMFSVYIAMLQRFSRQAEVGCSIISAGRQDAKLYGVMGFFVNSILFKIKMDGDEEFAGFIRRVHQEVMLGLHYQGFPVELVLEDLGMRYPAVSVGFNMLNLQVLDKSSNHESDVPSHIIETQDVKFDIELYVKEETDRLFLDWRYRKGVFSHPTIAHIAGIYEGMMDFFATDPRRKIKDYRERKKKNTFVRRYTGRTEPAAG